MRHPVLKADEELLREWTDPSGRYTAFVAEPRGVRIVQVPPNVKDDHIVWSAGLVVSWDEVQAAMSRVADRILATARIEIHEVTLTRPEAVTEEERH